MEIDGTDVFFWIQENATRQSSAPRYLLVKPILSIDVSIGWAIKRGHFVSLLTPIKSPD